MFCAISGCAKKKFLDDARALASGMTLDQKIGQLLIIPVPDDSVSEKNTGIIKSFLPGGILFFGYNCSHALNIKNFIYDLQKMSIDSTGIPLFISIDQEGGRVIRIVDGVTQFPGNMAAGIINDEKLTYEWGRILGLQLRELGVNMNLAPDIDVNNNPDNPVIHTRSFGSDKDVVARMGRNYLKGLSDSQCIPVCKHFPGHGDTNRDSHTSLPVMAHGMERLENLELVPFKKAIEAGADCIMTAHIAFPNILKTNDPATLSKYFLTDLLREEMKFGGLVITDDLEMGAISGRISIGEAAVKSFLAGADCILFSTYGESISLVVNSLKKAVLEKKIPMEQLNASVERILELKIRYGILTLNDRTVSLGTTKSSSSDHAMLLKAGEVNVRLSRDSIAFLGDSDLLKSARYTKILITQDSVLKKELKKIRPGFAVFVSLRDFLTYNPLESAGKVVVFYHVAEPYYEELKNVSDICRNNDIRLVIVCSGNPFRLAKMKFINSMILSFSSTEESLRQTAACLGGKFSPKSQINFHIGL